MAVNPNIHVLEDRFIPTETAAGIWDSSIKKSLVAQIAPSTPMIFGQTDFAVFTKNPSAEIVGEGEFKSGDTLRIETKRSKMYKVHVGVQVSEEYARVNPYGVLSQIGDQLSGAIARQLDLLTLFGREARGGTQVAGAEYVNQTSNRSTLPASLPAGSYLSDLTWDLAESVYNTSQRNVTAMAIDPSIAFKLGRERDGNGNPVTSGINIHGGPTNVNGLNTIVSPSVAGRLDGSKDTGVRMIMGDWDALKWGYAAQIGLEKIEYGDPFGQGDLKRTNSIGYRAEAFISYAIMDTKAFSVVEKAAA